MFSLVYKCTKRPFPNQDLWSVYPRSLCCCWVRSALPWGSLSIWDRNPGPPSCRVSSRPLSWAPSSTHFGIQSPTAFYFCGYTPSWTLDHSPLIHNLFFSKIVLIQRFSFVALQSRQMVIWEAPCSFSWRRFSAVFPSVVCLPFLKSVPVCDSNTTSLFWHMCGLSFPLPSSHSAILLWFLFTSSPQNIVMLWFVCFNHCSCLF